MSLEHRRRRREGDNCPPIEKNRANFNYSGKPEFKDLFFRDRINPMKKF